METPDQPQTPTRPRDGNSSHWQQLSTSDRHDSHLQQPWLGVHAHLGMSQKLGLRALTDLAIAEFCSSDYALNQPQRLALDDQLTTPQMMRSSSSGNSNSDSNSSSSSSTAGLSTVFPWVPTTPPATPSKLLSSSSVDSSSSSSSGPSSPRSLYAEAVQAPAVQQKDASAPPASVPASSSAVLEGLSDQARKVFRDKRVLIVSGGTRGDVQPATALGVALSALGSHVAMATDASFKEFVKQHGLQHYELGGNARDMMALTVKWGGMLPTDMAGMFWLRGQIREVMDSVWAAAEAFKPDLMLANQLAYGQVHAAEKLGVPLHVILTIPWLPTSSIAHPWARAYGANITEYVNAAARALLTPGFKVLSWFNPKMASRLQYRVLTWVDGTANYLSTPLLDHMAWSGIADLMAGFRHKLGLSQFSSNNLGSALYRYPTTCLFSSHLVPRPADWASHVSISGFLSLDETVRRCSSSSSSSMDCSNNELTMITSSSSSRDSMDCSDNELTMITSSSSRDSAQLLSTATAVSPTTGVIWQPTQELAGFLSAGPAPLYIGFGSMVVQDPRRLMHTVMAAVQQLPADQRVIICSGWSGLGFEEDQGDTESEVSISSSGSTSDRQLLFISEAPHDWLFPRCSALLHHGGVGTTAVGLRHGKPTLVVSAFGDLFFWGDVCHKLGVGPPAIPLDQLDSQTLAARLTDLATNSSYNEAAEAVAEQLSCEDGLVKALDGLAAALPSHE